jgi:hypothetical protein
MLEYDLNYKRKRNITAINNINFKHNSHLVVNKESPVRVLIVTVVPSGLRCK